MITIDVDCELPQAAEDLGLVRGELRLQLAEPRLRLADLIAQAVATQLLLRRAARAPGVEYLDEANVAQQRASGRVVLPSSPEGPDPQRAVERAWRAFEQRRFRVILDGEWLDDLQAEVTLHDDSKLVFLRLVPLVGG